MGRAAEDGQLGPAAKQRVSSGRFGQVNRPGTLAVHKKREWDEQRAKDAENDIYTIEWLCDSGASRLLYSMEELTAQGVPEAVVLRLKDALTWRYGWGHAGVAIPSLLVRS